MIVVDSSVWIDFLNGRNAPHVRRLRAILGLNEVILGDLMLCEVLQGLIVSMVEDAIAVAGARNFRFLRRRGITRQSIS